MRAAMSFIGQSARAGSDMKRGMASAAAPCSVGVSTVRISAPTCSRFMARSVRRAPVTATNMSPMRLCIGAAHGPLMPATSESSSVRASGPSAKVARNARVLRGIGGFTASFGRERPIRPAAAARIAKGARTPIWKIRKPGKLPAIRSDLSAA
jgi:hypothetical protein